MLTRTIRLTAIALLSLVILLLGLLLQGLLTAPSRSLVPPSGDEAIPASAATHPARTIPTAPRRAPLSSSEAVSVLRNAAPYNPLNHLRAGETHQVEIYVSSSSPIAMVGYLVPTGLTAAYGKARPNARHFVLSQKALGGGYLAAIFVQADGTGTPITCQVIVDGRRTAIQSTHGAYGATVCLG